MKNLLGQLFDKLGAPNEQKSETLALAIVSSMFLSFMTVNLLSFISIVELGKPEHLSSEVCTQSNFTSQLFSLDKL